MSYILARHEGHSTPLLNSTTGSPVDHAAMGHMMKTYFHFTGGDTVLFQYLTPRSGGTIFATVLVFFVLAVVQRYVSAGRRGAEMWVGKRFVIFFLSNVCGEAEG
jgi:glycerol-3-phosphate acyltransferase PlsY